MPARSSRRQGPLDQEVLSSCVQGKLSRCPRPPEEIFRLLTVASMRGGLPGFKREILRGAGRRTRRLAQILKKARAEHQQLEDVFFGVGTPRTPVMVLPGGPLDVLIAHQRFIDALELNIAGRPSKIGTHIETRLDADYGVSHPQKPGEAMSVLTKAVGLTYLELAFLLEAFEEHRFPFSEAILAAREERCRQAVCAYRKSSSLPKRE